MKKVLKSKDVDKVFACVDKLYNEAVSHLTDNFVDFSKGKPLKDKVKAYYPYVRIEAVAAITEPVK